MRSSCCKFDLESFQRISIIASTGGHTVTVSAVLGSGVQNWEMMITFFGDSWFSGGTRGKVNVELGTVLH